MKRKLIVVFVFLAVSSVLLAQTTENASGTQDRDKLFKALGFGFPKTENASWVVLELSLKDPKKDFSKNVNTDTETRFFSNFLKFRSTRFPLNIINPDLAKFEADVVIYNQTGPDKPPLAVPIGHLSLKLIKADPDHYVMTGRLKIRLEDKEYSGEYEVYLNELPKRPENAGEK